MVVTLANTFESGQSSGTAISTSNSGTGGNAFDSVGLGTGAAFVFDSTAPRGSLCGKFTTGSTSATALATWQTSIGTAQARVYVRATFRVDAITGSLTLFRIRGAGTQTCRVTVNSSTNKLELRNTANSVLATSTGAITVGSSVWRVALDVAVGSSAAATLYIYYNASSSTPDETLSVSAQNFGTSNVDEVNWGFAAALANSTLRLDDIVITSVALPGPAGQSASISDTLTSADSVSRAVALPRALGSAVTSADSLAFWLTVGGPVATALTEDTTATLANPERGFFEYSETHYLSDNSGYTALDSTSLTTARTTNGHTLVYRYFVMEKYLTVDTLDSAWLTLVAADISACRTAGVKLIPRFTYSTSGTTTAPYGDAPTIGRIIGHIQQLTATLNAGADVIPFLQAGFIGMWGEWYYTDNYGDQGTMTAAQWVDRKAVLTYLLALDSRIQVLLRYAGLKDKLLNGSNNVTALTDAFATQDTSKWSGYGTGVVATGGQLQITPTGSYPGLSSSATVDLVGHATVVQAVQTPNLGSGSTEMFLIVHAPDFNNRVAIGYSGGSLVLRSEVGGTTSDTTVTYNATNHQWWRIRENAGTVTWETSPSGASGTWTVQRTATPALTFTSGVWLQLNAGYWGTESSPGTAIFDNLSTDYIPPTNALTRIGFHNDAFLAPFADYGTYSTFSSMDETTTRAYVGTETARPLPNGGESATTNGTTSQWTEANIELGTYHFTFLNPDYYAAVLTSWGTNIDIAKRQLGYRLVGSQVRVSATVARGATLHVEVDLTNAGYAAPLTARDVVLVLDDNAGHRYETVLSVDIRTWAPGSSWTLSADVTVPAAAPTGTYRVALWMPDQTSTLRSRPEYAIRLANTGLWDSTNGYNTLTTVLVVTGSRSVNDSVTSGDSVARGIADPRATSDSVTAADSITRTATQLRAVNDTDSFADAASRAATGFARTATDTATTADSVGRGTLSSRATPDGAGLAGAAAGTLAASQTVSDAMGAAAAAVSAVAAPRATTDAVSAAGAVAPAAALPRGISDAVSAPGVPARGVVVGRSTGEGLTAAGGATAAGGLSLTASDTAGAADVASRVLGQPRGAGETLSAAGTATGVVAAARGAADVPGTADAAGTALNVVRAVTGSVAAADGVAGALAVAGVAAEPLIAAGQPTCVLALTCTPQDAASVAGGATVVTARGAGAAESMTLIDGAAVVRVLLRLVADMLAAAEAAGAASSGVTPGRGRVAQHTTIGRAALRTRPSSGVTLP